MNSLTDVKKLFEAAGHKITRSIGYELIVGENRFTLTNDIFYRNGIVISKKELLELIKTNEVYHV